MSSRKNLTDLFSKIASPRLAAALVAITSSAFAQIAFAQTTVDFGGPDERFRAGGDKTPPQCQVSYPSSTTENFFIRWNCVDRVSDQSHITSEVWIYRLNATRYEKIEDFLGFPASLQVTPGLLKARTIAEGLPISFRIVARDRAGVATVSEEFTIVAQDNSVDVCDLSIVTRETQATGSTTGLPAMTVRLEDVAVSTTQSANNNISIRTSEPLSADPCEIDSVCGSDSKVSFVATASIDDQNRASGNVNASPGNILSQVTGTASFSNEALSTLQLSGTALVDGLTADVVLSCGQRN